MGTPAQSELLAVAFGRRSDRGSLAVLRDGVAATVGMAGRIVYANRGVVVALCCVNGGQDRRAVAEGLRARVAKALGEEALSVGVARASRTATGAHLAVLQAQQALLLGRGLSRQGCATAFDDLGPFRFILGRPRRQIQEFCELVLGHLAWSDDEEHEDLLRTVEVWLRSRCGVNAVARSLHLHRNTVRQRLHRFTKLTGANLDDADTRLALHMAILGKRALACLGDDEWRYRALASHRSANG